MFEHIRKTKAKAMSLRVVYRAPQGTITYVSKNLPDAIAERTRLLASIAQLRRQLLGARYQHPAARMAVFALQQVQSPDHYETPEALAEELGRLNGCLDDLLRCLARMAGHKGEHISNIRFLAQYRQTSRKRDINSGWNRSKVDKGPEQNKDINASAMGPEQ